jgi:hypothetical protein
MRVSDRGVTGPCFVCGEESKFGGDWYGHNTTLYLCPDEDCHRALVALIFDSMLPISLTRERAHTAIAKFTMAVTSEYWRKMYLWSR